MGETNDGCQHHRCFLAEQSSGMVSKRKAALVEVRTLAAGDGECSNRESDAADATNSRSAPSAAAPVDAGPEPAFATCPPACEQVDAAPFIAQGAMLDVRRLVLTQFSSKQTTSSTIVLYAHGW